MSEIIVLDTHIWLWWVNREFDRFSDQWRDKIETANQVGVSPVSCFEIALAQKRGRLQLSCPAKEWCEEALTPSEIMLFPLTPEIASRAVNLSPIHKDPFDRIIIATALVYQANLASIDSVFSQYSELDPYLMK
ncbi:type II toxin-antitoxin system VapC family toxin [Planktothrix rubescens]|uniref:type II toxin-antitoxin system VapC family toxin n=1 Tax=Planktothrix rubescens TaxID=59512 RepID=UPI0004103A7F|nr:type II toxin-antitoxin system VapC family toxin [Planktothrix rubescens]